MWAIPSKTGTRCTVPERAQRNWEARGILSFFDVFSKVNRRRGIIQVFVKTKQENINEREGRGVVQFRFVETRHCWECARLPPLEVDDGIGTEIHGVW